MKVWLDALDCPERFHLIQTTDDGYDVRHGDGSECEQAEFKVEEDGDD